MAKIPIGQHLYLHTMASEFAPRVLITANGGIGNKMPRFNPPAGVTARFFTDHTTVLPNPGVTSVLEGKVSAKESITGGVCYNYELSKYQGRHGGTKGRPAETYESITRSLGNFASLGTGMMKMGGPVIEKATYEGATP